MPMPGYVFELAWRHFLRDKPISILIIMTLAIGIGTSVTALTVYHALARDPLPGHSQHLYRPQLDPRPRNDLSGPVGSEPYWQLSWLDIQILLRATPDIRQTVVASGEARIEDSHRHLSPDHGRLELTTADFFPLFGPRFHYGAGWTRDNDRQAQALVVLSDASNQYWFGGADSTGRELVINQHTFRVIGVLAPWQPLPRVYGSYDPIEYTAMEDFYIPLSTAIAYHIRNRGSRSCWDNAAGSDNYDGLLSRHCAWLGLWLRLDTAAQYGAYRQLLWNHSQQQYHAGRFQRPPNIRLRSVQDWLQAFQAVPADVRMQTWLTFAFLLVCMVNASALLLAKFLRQRNELAIRRALGASMTDLFVQLQMEAAVLGSVGGLAGLGLALGGLWLVRHALASDIDYSGLAHLDLEMVLSGLALALLSALLAALLPAWRASRNSTAIQLKST